MPSAKIPTNVHAKVARALDDIAKMDAGSGGTHLPIVIVTNRPPDAANLPGISPTVVTWPDGKTRVQGSSDAEEAAAEAGDGHYQFQVTLKLAAGHQSANEDILASLASAPGVIAIKAADGLTPDLHYSIPEVRARRLKSVTYPNNYDTATDVTQDGTGVIVGIVDFGLDFAHPNFIDASGPDPASRVLAIWDQNADPTNPYPPVDYYKPDQTNLLWYSESAPNSLYPTSHVYLRDDATRIAAGFPAAGGGVVVPPYLTAQLQSSVADPYWNYYDPHKNYYLAGPEANVIAHGTHVTDIAAGNGRADDCHSGVAPKSDIVFVQVKKPVLSNWKASAADVLNAVHFIFKLATKLNQPAVVNVSMNLYSGPHDGSWPWTTALSSEVRNDPDTAGGGRQLPRVVVVSAGNAYGSGQHVRFFLEGKDEESIRWTIPAGDTTENYLNLWYNAANDAADKLIVTVRNRKLIDGKAVEQKYGTPAPAKQIYSKVETSPGVHPQIGTIEARDNIGTKRSVRITISHLPNAHVPADAKRFVDVLVKWDGTASSVKRVHGWIERDNLANEGAEASFFRGNDRDEDQKKFDLRQTLGDMACGANIIAVGAINAPTDAGPEAGQERSLLDASSAGPPVDYTTLDDTIANDASAGFGTGQPWLVAPGVAIAAARSKGGRSDLVPTSDVMSGTSMAAPHVAGAVAILLQKNKDGAATKGHADIKAALSAGAFEPSATLDERSGWGRLHAKGAFDKLLV